MFVAPPCSSFSVAHRPSLRTRVDPEGTRTAPPQWAAYLRRHNELAALGRLRGATRRRGGERARAVGAGKPGGLWRPQGRGRRGDYSLPHTPRFGCSPRWRTLWQGRGREG
eukprot:3079307-Pleurochrysis_carterae.AAC.1